MVVNVQPPESVAVDMYVLRDLTMDSALFTPEHGRLLGKSKPIITCSALCRVLDDCLTHSWQANSDHSDFDNGWS